MTNLTFNDHLERMETTDVIAVDTETTGIAGIVDGRNYLMGISVSYRHTLGLLSEYFPFRHGANSTNLDPVCLARLRKILEDPSKRLIFHNLKFDLHSLATINIHPTGRLYDTLTIAHMINEEWPSKALDWLGKYLLHEGKSKDDLSDWLKMFKGRWESIPAELMAPYAKQDAELTYRLFDVLAPELEKQELHELWPIESRFIRDVLVPVERRGVKLDIAKCQLLSEQGTARMVSISDQLGFEPSRPTALADYLITQLGLPVVRRTPQGRPSFTKDAMEIYDDLLARSDNPTAKLVLEYRGWQKSVSSFYDGWLDRVSPDGRLRPNFKLHGTKTGRLSCENPNLQQIPRQSDKPWNGPAKSCFIEDDGYSLWEFDYSQLEFRLAGAYGDEPELKAAFADPDRDVFDEGAMAVFGSKDFRQDQKTLTYSTLYGAGVTRIMFALGLQEHAARSVIDRFHNTYQGIYTCARKAAQLAEQRGYVKYWTGRRRHFPDPTFSYKAFNSVIQGGAAEIVKRTMLNLKDDVDCDDARMLLQVHDSVWFRIRNECVEDVVPEVKRIMTNWPDFGITFAADAKCLSAPSEAKDKEMYKAMAASEFYSGDITNVPVGLQTGLA